MQKIVRFPPGSTFYLLHPPLNRYALQSRRKALAFIVLSTRDFREDAWRRARGTGEPERTEYWTHLGWKDTSKTKGRAMEKANRF